MESFGARFPHIYTDSGFKGWFVSTLLLGQLLASHIPVVCISEQVPPDFN